MNVEFFNIFHIENFEKHDISKCCYNFETFRNFKIIYFIIWVFLHYFKFQNFIIHKLLQKVLQIKKCLGLIFR